MAALVIMDALMAQDARTRMKSRLPMFSGHGTDKSPKIDGTEMEQERAL